MTTKLMQLIPYIFVAAIIGIAVIALATMAYNDTTLHDDTIVFCQYWNDGVYSNCEEWTRQMLDRDEDYVRYCLDTFEDNSWPEFGCMSELVE